MYVARMDTDIAKLNPANAPWLNAPSACRVREAIAGGGHQILFVGGCVRNALLDAPIGDVDMATSATPQQVIALTEAAGLKAVPTGIEHGTITVVSGGTGYEVTTFRRDVETDGRHAVVTFSTDIRDDARRRDFTMNALYADADGKVIDPLGGLNDLRARRVSFIEDAQERIREDYLRTLRYFRFHAWYGDADAGMDADALAAIAANLSGLETLSAERVGAELTKLLCAPDPSTSLGAMAQAGVLVTLLPGADIRLAQLVIAGAQHANQPPHCLGRLVALGGTEVPERLRMSKRDRQAYQTISSAAFDGIPLLETAFDHGVDIAVQAYLLQCALAERLPETSFISELGDVAEKVFPVGASDLMPTYQGPALGKRLAQMKTAWIASGFTMGKQDLLALPDI